LQPYSIVADDALLEIVISAVLPLDEDLSQTLHVSRNVVTSRCIVLFGIFLLGYALPNSSRTAGNDFDA
jgi:hypothetical protein